VCLSMSLESRFGDQHEEWRYCIASERSGTGSNLGGYGFDGLENLGSSVAQLRFTVNGTKPLFALL
jgi:hypothetical protein